MPDRDTMLGLASRVEQATGPDRELDSAIGRIAGPAKIQPDGTWLTCHKDGFTHSVHPPAYTASLDSAISLAGDDPGKWAITASSNNDRWQAWVWTLDDAPNWHEAATPALALCAAALRARAQIGGQA